ncbi:DUF6414 family protein [Streptococcus pasteurianus]|uniref:DUF6414 family protein n=1 Tax=Streptococcus pasteurianus TaxID=197614 RepID=UPI0020BD93EC|nr:DUF6414 family protein [Streptococcus pasteurianus]WCQ69588.1 DUF6414 family protein [Streptococcus pasteurianus]
MKKNEKSSKMMKVVYFDETAATDYITIQNGGQIDWSTTENKERLAKIIAEIDVQAKGGFNLFSFIKSSLSGNANVNLDTNTSKLIKSTVTNTLLTDYISMASKDKNIRQFHNDGVYAPKNSISMYRMYSSYLNIVPKEQIPIDLEGLNNALLGERGYYQMLLNSEKEPSCVLRFNINAFKNDYSLADLPKMNLSYFGVKVGQCTKEQLSLEKEFEINTSTNTPDVKKIVTGDTSKSFIQYLDVYDIVLAGVMSIE